MVVPTIVAGVEAPIVVASIVPALMSAVAAITEVNVPAAGVVPPIVASTVPALMSAVVATRVVIVAAAGVAAPMTVASMLPPLISTLASVDKPVTPRVPAMVAFSCTVRVSM